MHVFCALTIIVSAANESVNREAEIFRYLHSGISLLEQVQTENIVAKRGLEIVHRLLSQ
jgi:hypothetical protein